MSENETRGPSGQGGGGMDWSRLDPHAAEREAHRAERDARDASRESERGARDAAHEAEHAGGRAAREARREARRGHRIEVTGEGIRIGGMDVDAMGFGAFAKGFMKDLAGEVGGESYGETVSREFLFERMPRLRVRNISGETVVRVGEAGKVTVLARKRVSATSEDRAKRLLENLEVRMEQLGDELVVAPHLYEQERGWVDLFRGRRFRVDLEITVPRECAIDAQTVSGELSVTGTRGPLEVQAVSGDIAVVDTQGPLRLKSVSGAVGCRSYVGHVECNTVSGDVTFESVRIRSIQLQTVSGDVELTGVLEPGHEHRFRSISGDVELGLVDPDVTVEYRTASGDLEAEVVGRVEREGRKEYRVTVGGGHGRALVKTVSGDLTLASAEAAVPGEPSVEEPGRAEPTVAGRSADASDVERTEPMAAPVDHGVRAVLERLAKGELNVDAAAAAIDEARRGG